MSRNECMAGQMEYLYQITTHHADNGSFKLVFNGKTIIDCKFFGCDAMFNPNHKQFYEDEWAFK